jgi:hypothetical protein
MLPYVRAGLYAIVGALLGAAAVTGGWSPMPFIGLSMLSGGCFGRGLVLVWDAD